MIQCRGSEAFHILYHIYIRIKIYAPSWKHSWIKNHYILNGVFIIKEKILLINIIFY